LPIPGFTINTMNDAAFNQLLDTALRRKLSAEEEARVQAFLARDPRARAVWEAEMALNQLLNGLPDAPLASNFTAQVLQAVDRDSRHRRASKLFRWVGLRPPAQRYAAACLAVVLAALGYWKYESVRRERMALALHRLAPHFDTPSTAVALAPDELWRNFDAINRLPQTQTDEELLAVLKEVAMK
jgi:anti-sigma factor RsiW